MYDIFYIIDSVKQAMLLENCFSPIHVKPLFHMPLAAIDLYVNCNLSNFLRNGQIDGFNYHFYADFPINIYIFSMI